MDPDWITDLFAPFAPVTVRRMFGGHGVYRDGLMFALATGGDLYLKVDASNRRQFEDAGSRPFAYSARGRTVEVGYWLLPPEAFDDPDRLSEYAGLAWEAALRARNRRAPAKKPKRP
ncbi:TfoX/Sxy family protein [Faunimonas sp. B44]|uniref:TfoX/Sxy family protein n=1 Tax=Faunimonas sp. B44 TaxID=3461493 RepID=UPI0040443B10